MSVVLEVLSYCSARLTDKMGEFMNEMSKRLTDRELKLREEFQSRFNELDRARASWIQTCPFRRARWMTCEYL